MKKLIVALMVLSTLASCGKDNKVASATTAATSPITTPVTTADQVGVALGQKIDSYTTQFGFAQVNYYTTIGQLANQGYSITYSYTKDSSSVSNPDCEKKWIFTICSSSSSSSNITANVSRTVQNTGVNVTTKINELKAIINAKHAAYPIQVNGYSYWIKTSDNKEYIIDTRMPIQANPVGIYDPATNSKEYMFKYNF